MPQQTLLSLHIPLHIGHVSLSLPRATIEMRLPMGEAGRLNVSAMHLSVSDISNDINKTLTGSVRLNTCGGKGDIHLRLKNDNECTFNLTTKLEDIDGKELDSFLLPVLGLTVNANVHSLESQLNGDNKQAEGNLCMIYDSLKLHFVKEDVPLQKLAKNANVINTLAPLGIYSHNPRQKKATPYTSHFVHERNDKQNFASYLSGSITDGILQTVMTDILYGAVKKTMTKARDKEQGVKNKEQRTRNKEQGIKNKE